MRFVGVSLHSLRLGLMVVLACFGASSAIADGAPGVRRALLIGVNDYRAVPALQGSVNDIETMQEILVARWGFAPSNVRVLRDAQGTRAGILSALQQLVAQSQPNDLVYVHYSGHGSQVQDLNGDEPDGLDETIVPQDGRSAGVPDITDDELDAIFARLRARSALIVLDSCHSGTATRALDIRTRSVPRDTRTELYRSASVATRAIVPRMQARYVVISGAADNQEALDGPIAGRYHGFFTYAFSRSIASSPPAASIRYVFTGVERELRRIQSQFGRASMPEPQLEAPPALLDQPLLNAPTMASTQDPRLASLQVQPAGAGRVALINGALLGGVVGSTWAIYAPGDTAFVPGRALAVATVVQLNGRDALAALQSNVFVPMDARAVLALPAPAAQRIGVRVSRSALRWRQEIESFLTRTVPGAQLVADDKSARYLIDADDAGLKLLTADGLQVLSSLDLAAGAPGAVRLISQAQQAADLLSIDNPAAQLRIDANVVGAHATVSRNIALVADTSPARLHVRAPGEPRSPQNSLQLEIVTDRDAYITIVDVGLDGAVNLLFPNDYQARTFQPQGRVRANEVMTIPDSLAAGNRAGFYWDYSPPSGMDTVRIFASTDLATAEAIRQRIRSMQGFGGLRADMQLSATRGIKVVPAGAAPDDANSAPADWTAMTLTIAIEN
jgi:hypothetical protein